GSCQLVAFLLWWEPVWLWCWFVGCWSWQVWWWWAWWSSGLEGSAVGVGEHPLCGSLVVAVSGDGQVVLVDQGVVPPAQQDPVLGAGVSAVVPPQAVVDLSDTRWGGAARVLAVPVAGDDRPGLGRG